MSTALQCLYQNLLLLLLQEQSDAAAVAVAELGPVLQAQQLLAPLELQLQGLSHFRHQVGAVTQFVMLFLHLNVVIFQ
jgi:hypothetical protein